MRELALAVAADGRVDAEEVLALRRAIFPDGVVSRAEAQALLDVDAAVAEHGPEWRALFVDTMVDHLIGPSEGAAHVCEDVVAWLAARLDAPGRRRVGAEIALKVLERAYSAPEALAELARRLVAEALRVANRIDAEAAELVRRALYAQAGAGGVAVTRAEADWLFDLDAALHEREQDGAFADVFVKAIANHLCGMGPSQALERDAMLARQRWLDAPTPGVAGILRETGQTLRGGFPSLWREILRATKTTGGAAAVDAAYEAKLRAGEANAALTAQERAWLEARILRDGVRTTSEEKLLAALGALADEG